MDGSGRASSWTSRSASVTPSPSFTTSIFMPLMRRPLSCVSSREEVHLLTVKIDAARREALLYRDEVLPRSEQALASASASWQTGEGSFRDVLDACRMVLEARLMYARAVSEQYEMLSDLVLCCGLGDLEALQMIGAQPETPTGEKRP